MVFYIISTTKISYLLNYLAAFFPCLTKQILKFFRI